MSTSASRNGATILDGTAGSLTRRSLLALTAAGTLAGTNGAVAAPQGQLTYGVHVSLAPTWFDPAESAGIITPYMLLYGLHDALLKAMPDSNQAPSLAESFSASEDGLTYEFVLRKGVTFHNGDPVTADDVKFSFERYRGASQSLLEAAGRRDRDAGCAACAVQAEGAVARLPHLLCRGQRRRLDRAAQVRRPRSATTASRRRPIGAGPYRFVSFTPGVELVLEAFEGYWRKTPSVKRLVMKVIPDEATRLAALEAGRDRHRLSRSAASLPANCCRRRG